MIPRADIAAMIEAHPLPRRVLAERAHVSERTIQRILYGTRSGNGGCRYVGRFVSLDTADRICLALGEMLP